MAAYIKPDQDLSKEAKKVWKQLVTSMSPGFYTELDRGLLRPYCREYARYEKLYKQVEAEGEVIEINGQPKINPQYSVMMKAADSIARWARQLKACKSAVETHRAAAKASQASTPKAKSSRAGLMYGDQAEQAEKVLN